MRAEWQRLRSNDCVDSFTADAVAIFFPRTCVKHKQHDKIAWAIHRRVQMNVDIMSM